MERRAKVELFEQIRREYEFGVGTINGVAKKFGVHRRMVRQALLNAVPPERKTPHRESPKVDAVKEFIDAILESDRRAPRKQRHTAHRIYIRTRQELSTDISEPSVRRYVRVSKRELGLSSGEIFIPQSYQLGQEAQVDWYEAVVGINGEQQKAYFFTMRSMSSGGAFHRAYPRATQQAFFEAHEAAFNYFGGVFRTLRYDNLGSAVKKILRGHTRVETTRFVAFRSHWRFEAEFCNVARGNEKGGVEGEVGYFRRNHLVPVPKVSDFAELNRQLVEACRNDQQRTVGERPEMVRQGMEAECAVMLPLAAEPFEIAEVSFPIVDQKGCVRVSTNWYSTPLRAGTRARAVSRPITIEVWSEGKLIARHERCYGRAQQVLNLEHYLEVLERKPGAFAGSTPLKQWRERGRWPESFDLLWSSLQRRHGKEGGTRQMIELLMLGRAAGYERLKSGIEHALKLGCTDAAAVRYLMQAEGLNHAKVAPLHLAGLEKYERALPVLTSYDELLHHEQEVA